MKNGNLDVQTGLSSKFARFRVRFAIYFGDEQQVKSYLVFFRYSSFFKLNVELNDVLTRPENLYTVS